MEQAIRQKMIDLLPVLEEIKWLIIREKYQNADEKITELTKRYNELYQTIIEDKLEKV